MDTHNDRTHAGFPNPTEERFISMLMDEPYLFNRYGAIGVLGDVRDCVAALAKGEAAGYVCPRLGGKAMDLRQSWPTIWAWYAGGYAGGGSLQVAGPTEDELEMMSSLADRMVRDYEHGLGTAAYVDEAARWALSYPKIWPGVIAGMRPLAGKACGEGSNAPKSASVLIGEVLATLADVREYGESPAVLRRERERDAMEEQLESALAAAKAGEARRLAMLPALRVAAESMEDSASFYRENGLPVTAEIVEQDLAVVRAAIAG